MATPELFISRQPVVDGEMRVSGYRVAYSTADGQEAGDSSAARLLGDVLSGVGLEELVGESPARLPLSRDVLLSLGVPPVRLDNGMVRIDYETARDLTGGPSTPPELSVVGLTRARMCELLGSDRGYVGGDQLFTVGLLSVADALLDVPLETIVDELPLADEVAAALLRRAGPAGSILDAVVSYEQGEFDAAASQAHSPGIASSYRDALGWAVETVSALN
jgi:c-di-GMP-related signal transduction protein